MANERARGGVRPVTQDRAKATLDALVIAGEQLLDGRDPEAVSLEEILVRAGASASSFYQRFGSKDRFVDHLHERLCAKIREDTSTWTDLERWRGMPLEDAAREGITAYLRFRRTNGGALRSLKHIEARHAHAMDRRRRVDSALAERVRACVLALRSRDGRAPSVARLNLALDLAVSNTRTAVDDGERVRAATISDDAQFVGDLATALVSYLIDAP